MKKKKPKYPNIKKVKSARNGAEVSGLTYLKVRGTKRIVGWLTREDGQPLPHVWNLWGQDAKNFENDLIFK